MSKIDLYKKLFKLIELKDLESKILIAILNNNNKANMSALLNETGISRATLYQYLNSLNEKKIVKKYGKRPVYYSITEDFDKNLKAEISNLIETLSSEIVEIKIEETQEIIKEINYTFQREGYIEKIIDKSIFSKIRKTLPISDMFSSFFNNAKIKKFEKFFSVVIILIDTKSFNAIKRNLRSNLFNIVLQNISETLNCAFTFILFKKDINNVYRITKEISYRHSKRYKNNTQFIVIDLNLEDILKSELQKIEDNIRMNRDLFVILQDKIDKIENLIILSQSYCNTINKFVTEASIWPSVKLSGLPIKELTTLIEPVEKITSRELRNLQIYNIRYREIFINIKNYMAEFENRIKMPSIDQIKKDLNHLDFFLEKFKPIEYELDDLQNIIFNYGLNLIMEEKPEKRKKFSINPFFMTEPFEPENFYIDQELIEKNLKNFFQNVIKNGQDFFRFIKGDAGTGKTHALRYICTKLEKELKLKMIHINCSVGFDLIPIIFKEISQEILYPSEIRGYIRKYRNKSISTMRELFVILKEIKDLLLNLGYEGFILLIDEFENIFHYKYLENQVDLHEIETPLVVNQLKEFISFAKINYFGLVISARTKVYKVMDYYFNLKDFKQYIFEPSKLSLENYYSIIENRYKVWNATRPKFEEKVLKEIIKITDNNVRNVLRYLRELYKIAQEDRIREIKMNDLNKIGVIPIFQY